MHRLVARWSSTVLLLALTVTGCTSPSSGDDPPSADSERRVARAPYRYYVALGDSYTAAPYVPSTDLADGCLRSDGNYPALVARRLGIASLTDVSCSGARTRDMFRRQPTFRDASRPAQLKAVTRRADLVTVGVGGNDFDLFSTLVGLCAGLRSRDPSGAPCARQLAAQGVDSSDDVRRTGLRVTRVLAAVRRRAPEATVVLVGYPRLAPSQATCAALPLADGDYEVADRLARELDSALSRAAAATDAAFAAVYQLSAGHDVCSSRPWVNGRVTDQSAALAFHPFPAGQRAVAREIVSLVR